MNDKTPIFRSLAMIEERIQEKLTVEMLAEGIHFSKYHYQRIFQEAVGDTVMGYVTRRKLFLAAGELAGTNASVLAIALKYGYGSHEGFARSFKAYLGVTPTEYRKYHSAIGFPVKKEESEMMNPKILDEIIRELNALIVQAKETAANTEKYKGADGKAAAVYAQVWEFASERTERTAGRLKEILERVTAITQCPDGVTAVIQRSNEISACFLIMKAVEDAAFEASVTAFQAGLMIARAMPEYRTAFCPLCDQYDYLAQNAREKSGKIANYFYELSVLIFQDIRKEATQRIQNAVGAGRMAAGKLADPALPYGYIADGIKALVEELAALPLADVSVYFLEDAMLRLETILFAADMDMLRAPQHRPLFDGISDFKEKLGETAEFFRGLSQDAARAFAVGGNDSERKLAAVENGSEMKLGTVRNDSETEATMGKNDTKIKLMVNDSNSETGIAAGGSGFERNHAEERIYRELVAQEDVLLFYLKGEIQKLGDAHLNEEQKKALNAVCGKMDRMVKMARNTADEKEWDGLGNYRAERDGIKRNQAKKDRTERNRAERDKIDRNKITELLREIYEDLTACAKQLGVYGGAIQYLADEVKKPLRYLPELK